MFDVTLQIMAIEVVEAEDHAEILVTPCFLLPMQTPMGPQPVPIPAGNVRIPLRKNTLVETIAKMQEVADKLPDDAPATPSGSGLVVANSLQGVDEVAKLDQQFKGGRR